MIVTFFILLTTFSESLFHAKTVNDVLSKNRKKTRLVGSSGVYGYDRGGAATGIFTLIKRKLGRLKVTVIQAHLRNI